MTRKRVVLFACAMCVGAGTGGAAAQSRDEIAVMSCQNKARQELRGPAQAAEIRFAPNETIFPMSRAESGVRGGGEFLARSGGPWRPFTYECGYRKRSARTSIRVVLDSAGRRD